MKPITIMIAFALACSLSSIVQAQELEDGTWSGVGVRNGRPLSITFEVKRVPDPHTRWRPGAGEILNVTLMRGQNSEPAPLSEVRLNGETLSYRIPAMGDLHCSLTRQEDRSFAGDCVRGDDGALYQFTMIPPED